jgi:hypothetical protein
MREGRERGEMEKREEGRTNDKVEDGDCGGQE